jgi:hypothetical protein
MEKRGVTEKNKMYGSFRAVAIVTITLQLVLLFIKE